MPIELPLLQNCCFCLPLRGGLMAWGYLKLTIASFMLGYFIPTLFMMIAYEVGSKGRTVYTLYDFGQTGAFLFVATVDVALHSVFIKGCGENNVKLLKVYHFYSLLLVVLTALFSVICLGIIVGLYFNNLDRIFTTSMYSKLSILFINLLIHGYVILLVKSQIRKLEIIAYLIVLKNRPEAENN